MRSDLITSGIVDPACPLDWSHPLNRGLVGRWKVVNNSGWRGGNTFRDLVRGGRLPHDGAFSGGPTWSGGAIQFDGINDLINFGNLNSLFSAETATLNVRIRLVDTGTYNAGWGFSGNAVANFYYNGTGKIDDGTFKTTREEEIVSITDRFVWNTVTITRTSGANGWNFYQNARLTHSASGGTWSFNADAIIARNDFANGWLTGWISDVHLFNRALSALEVAAVYQEQRRGSPETLRWITPKVYSFAEAATPAIGDEAMLYWSSVGW